MENRIDFVLQVFENARQRQIARLRALEEELYDCTSEARSGEILLEIRDDELFKEDDFRTFEQYFHQLRCSEDEADELIQGPEGADFTNPAFRSS
jgi:hypothetical protein